MNYRKAKLLFKNNIIGPDEFDKFPSDFQVKIGKNYDSINLEIKNIDYSKYILVFGPNQFTSGDFVNIKNISIFGTKLKPNWINFYNQDWYFNEEFCQEGLENKWYLIKKDVIKESRGSVPSEKFINSLPKAILCTFLFFSWWLKTKEILWENDFIWCSDFDSHGDQIYVGKYNDMDNPRRSGFSIHRHLSIRNNYGCITSIT